MVGVDQGWKIEDENKSQKEMKRKHTTCNVMGHTIGRHQNIRKTQELKANNGYTSPEIGWAPTHLRASSPNTKAPFGRAS